MRTFSPLVVVLAATSLNALLAQAAPPPAAAASVPASSVPAANTAAATALFDQACDRMLALGRGAFRCDEEQDAAILRGRDLPMGKDAPSVRGGWQNALVWGDTDDDAFAILNGRMVTKTDAGWKLRARTLASGAAAPFVLSPTLLFQQLRELPAAHKRIACVEASEVGGKPVAILALSFAEAIATDLALGGALPAPSGGMMMGLGGMFGGQMPEKTYTVDLALFVEPQSGDVLRLRVRVYEDNPMLANVRLQFGGGGGQEDVDVDADQQATDAGSGNNDADQKLKWKKGLPDRKPGKTESVVYLKVDFKDLGTASAPALDENGKRWLGLK